MILIFFCNVDRRDPSAAYGGDERIRDLRGIRITEKLCRKSKYRPEKSDISKFP